MKTVLRLGLLMTLLVLPFMWATSFAKEVPFKISYTGALVPIPVNLSSSLTSATVMDAQSHGTFGASMSHVVTEWVEVPETKCDGDYADYNYYYLMHASSVITFSNDDQLYGAGAIWDSGVSGWMCLNPADGHFVGVAKGDFRWYRPLRGRYRHIHCALQRVQFDWLRLRLWVRADPGNLRGHGNFAVNKLRGRNVE